MTCSVLVSSALCGMATWNTSVNRGLFRSDFGSVIQDRSGLGSNAALIQLVVRGVNRRNYLRLTLLHLNSHYLPFQQYYLTCSNKKATAKHWNCKFLKYRKPKRAKTKNKTFKRFFKQLIEANLHFRTIWELKGRKISSLFKAYHKSPIHALIPARVLS